MRSTAAPSQRVLYVAEPPAVWPSLPPAVVDASVVAAVLWAEPAAAQAQVRMSGHSLHAPFLLIFELINVARNKHRSGVPLDVARAGLQELEGQRIGFHKAELETVFELACAHELTAYDAAYLSLALQLRAPLLTFDRRLAEAMAKAQGDPR
jgi:predicted nucleic acid-binding protein